MEHLKNVLKSESLIFYISMMLLFSGKLSSEQNCSKQSFYQNIFMDSLKFLKIIQFGYATDQG